MDITLNNYHQVQFTPLVRGPLYSGKSSRGKEATHKKTSGKTSKGTYQLPKSRGSKLRVSAISSADAPAPRTRRRRAKKRVIYSSAQRAERSAQRASRRAEKLEYEESRTDFVATARRLRDPALLERVSSKAESYVTGVMNLVPGFGVTPAVAGAGMAAGIPSPSMTGVGVVGARVAGASVAQASGRLRTNDDIPRAKSGVGGFVEGDVMPGGVFSGSARRHNPAYDALKPLATRVVQGLSSVARRPVIVVLLLLAIVFAMLYGPARNLYVANRRIETLQQTYDILQDENDQLEREVNYLQSEEGIETEARSHGYIAEGEVKVRVEGLPETNTDDEMMLLVGDVELPDERPWYVRLADGFFGYDPEA